MNTAYEEISTPFVGDLCIRRLNPLHTAANFSSSLHVLNWNCKTLVGLWKHKFTGNYLMHELATNMNAQEYKGRHIVSLTFWCVSGEQTITTRYILKKFKVYPSNWQRGFHDRLQAYARDMKLGPYYIRLNPWHVT